VLQIPLHIELPFPACTHHPPELDRQCTAVAFRPTNLSIVEFVLSPCLTAPPRNLVGPCLLAPPLNSKGACLTRK
jgi:hypothetical protein